MCRKLQVLQTHIIMFNYYKRLMMAKNGLLIVLSGPSGVGKGTIRRLVMSDITLNMVYSISMTTRKPREMEVDGKDYFFVNKNKFEEMIHNDGFLEYAQFVGNYYGTPKDYVLNLLKEGKNVFLEIEINGAKQVMEKYKGKNLVTIFLVPPSIQELENRIRNRHTEDEQTIQERLNKARHELSEKDNYDYVVVNDDIYQASREIQNIIRNKQKEIDG